jgi:superfamily II DNA or RNA helicase
LVFGGIGERLGQIQNRGLVNFSARRRLYDWNIKELTGRISSAEIPEVLKRLEIEFNRAENKALDICLATNMVATGVDISRLGLMFIHGQPKTTTEYIQASSRVGRELPEGPGLVFTLFSPARPRDKSQYEQFRGYHSRIYSNVEPTSVTPFSMNARERVLHAIVIGMVRHFSKDTLREKAGIHGVEFDELTSKVKNILLTRCENVDHNEAENTGKLIDKRIMFWKKGFDHYGDAGNYQILQTDGFVPLMYANSAEVREYIINEQRSLATPTSMRGVDTESVVSIYNEE